MARRKTPLPVSAFSGMTRTIQCYDHNGWRNYRIVTLILEKGVVVKEYFSDPFMNAEAIQKLDLFNDYAQHRLMMAWEHDKAWFLKKDKEGKNVLDVVSG